MRKVLAFIIAVTLLFPVIAFAEEGSTSGKNYIELKGGQYKVKADDFPIQGGDATTGSNIELSVGRRLSRYIAVEATYGRFRIEDGVQDYQFLDATNTVYTVTNVVESFDVYPIVGTVKFMYPIGEGSLYLGGGYGLYKVIWKEDSNIDIAGKNYSLHLRDEDTVNGWHVMAGTLLDIGDHWSLGVEYKEVRVESAKIKHKLLGFNWDVDMDGRMLNAFIQARF